MAWKIEVSSTAERDLRKLDRTAQKRILNFLRELIGIADPRSKGKALQGGKKGLWRYRVGDYRLICDIREGTITIIVLTVAHRKDVYR